MKSNSIEKRVLLITAAVFSISGLLLRYLQITGEILPDGSLVKGAFLHYILLALTVCFIVGTAVLLRRMPKTVSWKQSFRPMPAFALLHILAAGLLLIGNVVLLIEGPAPASPYVVTSPGFSSFLNRALPVLGIAAAVCLGVFVFRAQAGQRPSPLLYMCASLYLVIRLIVCFQAWNTDPSIHDYCYMLLAAICTMLAAFQLAGFSFDRGKSRMTLFWTLCSVLFCSMSLYLIIRLIVCFQAWNTDPSIYDYCYMLLAAICTMLAAFQLAGFSFDKGKRRITLFWTLSSVFFCCISMADAVHDGDLGSMLVMLALLLTNTASSIQLLFAADSGNEAADSDDTGEEII